VIAALNPTVGNHCENGGRGAGGRSGRNGPDAAAVSNTSHSPGVLSGNNVQVPIDLPINLCGDSVNVVGLLNPAIGNHCENGGGGEGGGPRNGPDAAAVGNTDDSPGVISGNSLQLPINIPINLCGDTVNVIGLLNPAIGNGCENGGGGEGVRPPVPVHHVRPPVPVHHIGPPVVPPLPISGPPPVIPPAPISAPVIPPAPISAPVVPPAPISAPVVPPAPISAPVVPPAPISAPIAPPAPVSGQLPPTCSTGSGAGFPGPACAPAHLPNAAVMPSSVAQLAHTGAEGTAITAAVSGAALVGGGALTMFGRRRARRGR
jgi:hypothetical protein